MQKLGILCEYCVDTAIDNFNLILFFFLLNNISIDEDILKEQFTKNLIEEGVILQIPTIEKCIK